MSQRSEKSLPQQHLPTLTPEELEAVKGGKRGKGPGRGPT